MSQPDTSDVQSILLKIRKLRALSTSSNEHEAAAAAAQADRLIQKYRIDEAQLDASSDIVKDSRPLEQFHDGSVYWKMCLIGGLCDGHGCLSYTAKHKVDPNDQQVWLVGRASDMAITRAMYEWLASEIERLSVHAIEHDWDGFHYRSSTWLSSYQLGCVRGCVLAMRSAADDVRAAVEAGAARTALVRLDARVQEAEDEFEKLQGGPVVDAGLEMPPLDAEAFARGEEDGRVVGQVRELGGGGGEGGGDE